MTQIVPDKMLGDLESIDKLIAKRVTERQRLTDSQQYARENLISTARDLVSLLETPLEVILWMICAEVRQTRPPQLACD